MTLIINHYSFIWACSLRTYVCMCTCNYKELDLAMSLTYMRTINVLYVKRMRPVYLLQHVFFDIPPPLLLHWWFIDLKPSTIHMVSPCTYDFALGLRSDFQVVRKKTRHSSRKGQPRTRDVSKFIQSALVDHPSTSDPLASPSRPSKDKQNLAKRAAPSGVNSSSRKKAKKGNFIFPSSLITSCPTVSLIVSEGPK